MIDVKREPSLNPDIPEVKWHHRDQSNLNCSSSSLWSTVTDEPVIGVGVSFTELVASHCMSAGAAGGRKVQDSQTLQPGWRFGWK